MKARVISVLTLLQRLGHDRRGVAAAIFALSLVATLGSAAFVIDIGNLFVAHRTLQAATDAAALAGAADINCCILQPGKAKTTARSFSAVAGAANASDRMAVTMTSGYPKLTCIRSTAVTCAGSDLSNAIVVKQEATVQTIFARILGINSMQIAAQATAAANAGKPKPLDVMIVLDTTGSMNNADPSCSITGASRLTCALTGARTLLATLSPSVDKVGLMVFPGTSSKDEAKKNHDCKNKKPKIVKYSSTAQYEVLGLSNNYRSSDTANAIDPSSDLVRAFQGGGASCPNGVSAVGGVGTFFADAIKAAQTSLRTTGRTDVQKVIIVLSDGDAGAPAGNMVGLNAKNQCLQAVTAAQTAADEKTWVYAIAYGAPTAGKPTSCPSDMVTISACETMQRIASDPSKFYSDKVGGGSTCTSAAHSVSELVGVFSSIAESFRGARLISDNTT